MATLPYILRGAVQRPLSRLRRQTATVDVAPPSREGRLYALDLARFIAMVFMMQGHVLDAIVQRGSLDIDVFPWNVWHIVRGLTAPIFLVVSGAVHAFANKRGQDGLILETVIEKRIRWAITLIGLGYLMVFPANRVWDLPFVSSASWTAALAVNILQLTGVTILLFVLVMRTSKNIADMGRRGLFTALGILVLTPIMRLGLVEPLVPSWFVPYLHEGTGSLFPIFPFASYLFFGVALGAYLHAVPAETRHHHIRRYLWRGGAVLAGAALVAHGIGLLIGYSASQLDNIGSVILVFRRLGIVLMLFSASAALIDRVPSLRHWGALFGKKSLHIYVIHLVLLYGTPWYDGIGRTHFRSYDLPTGLLIVVAIMIVTLAVAWGIDVYERSTALSAQTKRRISAAMVTVLVALLVV